MGFVEGYTVLIPSQISPHDAFRRNETQSKLCRRNTEGFPSHPSSFANPGVGLLHIPGRSLAHISPSAYLQYEPPHLPGPACCDRCAHCCGGEGAPTLCWRAVTLFAMLLRVGRRERGRGEREGGGLL